jgi:peptide/nickel transport system permease protein
MGLRSFLTRRVITAIITVVIVIVFNFFLFRIPTFLYGQDPADLYISPDAPIEVQDLLRQAWNLPPKNATFGDWWNYFTTYFVNLVTFRFITEPSSTVSFFTHLPIATDIMTKLPNTVMLIGVSTLFATLGGIIAGVIAASRHGGKFDTSFVTVGLSLYSLPIFWIGLILLMVFGFFFRSWGLPYFPTFGSISYPVPTNPIDKAVDYLWHLTLPAATLALGSIGYYFLLMRNNLIDVLTEDYIVTARAKGVPGRTVLFKHAMRNAFLPMVTIIALQVAYLWTGATLTETVFSWDGMGRYIFNSLVAQDWPAAEVVFFLIAISVVVANLAADVLYGILDPRVRYE